MTFRFEGLSRSRVLALVVVLLAPACGGRAAERAIPSGGAGGVAGDGSGGASVGSGGAAAGSGGAAGYGGSPSTGPSGWCISSCASADTITFDTPVTAIDGGWGCADGRVRYEDCSIRACAKHKVRCCDLTTGDVTLADCQPDGTRGGCPTGTAETLTYQCIPADLTVSNCNDLDRQPCSTLGQWCWESGLNYCTCAPAIDGSDGPAWACRLVPP